MSTNYESLLEYAINAKKSWLYYMPEGCYINFDLLVDYHESLSKYFDEIRRNEPQKADAIIYEYERIIEGEDILFESEDFANIINEIKFEPYKDFIIEMLNENLKSNEIDDERRHLQEKIVEKINKTNISKSYAGKNIKEKFLISYLLCKYNEYLEKYVEVSLRDFLKENETVKNICNNLSSIEVDQILKRTQLIMKQDFVNTKASEEKEINVNTLSRSGREILLEIVKAQEKGKYYELENEKYNKLTNFEKEMLTYATTINVKDKISKEDINKLKENKPKKSLGFKKIIELIK